MDRRDFIQSCALSAAVAGLPALAQEKASPRYYHRARLVDANGVPLKSRSLAAQRNFIFHYPYAGTPCFLLNLGKPVKGAAALNAAPLKTADAKTYQWQGGIGANASVVAYSAICAHRLTYPTRDISFISFRTDSGPRNKQVNVIHCCSEHSQYDPAEGGRVVAGPAPQPLATILLEYDSASDGIYAVGTLGGEMFNEFFSKFDFKLALEHNGSAKRPVTDRIVVSELTQYCRQQVKC